MRAAFALLAALVFPALLAGCASPTTKLPCETLVLTPQEEVIRAGEQFVQVSVQISNCGTEVIELESGPCGHDVLPRLTRGNDTWVLVSGAALFRESLTCDEPAKNTTVAPGKAAYVTARWNGLVEDETGAFVRAAPGDYVTSATAFGETVTGKVRIV